MGTRIKVIFEHQVKNHHDHIATTDILAATIPATLAVANYWRTVADDPKSEDSTQDSWTVFSPKSSEGYLRYEGPGALFLQFGPKVAAMFTGARWRGFLSIEPLRRVHLAAFRNIARHLGGKRVVFFPSEGIADDLVPAVIYQGITLDECITMLQQAYGPPQPSIDNVTPQIVAEADQHVPSVWYMETL